MPATSGWELTPRQSIDKECARRGRGQVVAGCVALLRRQDVDDDLVIALGGPMSQLVLDDGPRQANQYWRRVWGARGLLHCYDSQADEAVTEALADEHWRVREMAAKVVARHRIGAAFDAVLGLRDDPVPRVRTAATRATIILTAARS
ncbi:MAG: HEAT repeat domain-containing protein [Streptosporangiaceae bacterium]